MKLAVRPTTSAVEAPSLALGRRVADYVELTKPRIAVMVLVTVAAGYLMAARADARLVTLLHTLIGTGLVAAGASAWNNWIERVSDAKMNRTAHRPLPAGRLHHLEVLVFGTALAVTGVNYLLHALPTPYPALIAALTFFTYVAVYTPLKPVTTLNTHIGAIPGALPPVIGWCAVTGRFDPQALALFAILFLWQVPHFLAIAWMYREEYARAGLQMLPGVDPDGRITAMQMRLYCLALMAGAMMPVFLGSAGVVYVVGSLALGVYFLLPTLAFGRERSTPAARRVLRASLVYLPGLLLVLLLDRSVALLSGR